MKKVIIALLVCFSLISFQNASAQKIKHQKVYTSSPGGKAYGYREMRPERRTIHFSQRRAYGYREMRPQRRTIHFPQGRAVGWHGRNPNKANGRYKH